MSDVKFVTVADLKAQLQADPGIMVVSTYMMEQAFEMKRIAPAMPMYEFIKQADDLPRDRHIVFY
jgi:hypothetical protein